jgi:hypothetical protein
MKIAGLVIGVAMFSMLENNTIIKNAGISATCLMPPDVSFVPKEKGSRGKAHNLSWHPGGKYWARGYIRQENNTTQQSWQVCLLFASIIIILVVENEF